MFVARRPVLTPAATPTDEHSLHLTRAHVVRTVREVRDFADALHARTAVSDPAAAGSAQAIASSTVQMCHAFVRNWPNGSRLTPTQVAQFNQELELVQAMLDALAIRGTPDSAPLVPGRAAGLLRKAGGDARGDRSARGGPAGVAPPVE
jgi:hypothetical protein